MAIQIRNGAYVDLNKNKLLIAEPAVVTEGDPNTEDGTATYVCYGGNTTHRLVHDEEIEVLREDMQKTKEEIPVFKALKLVETLPPNGVKDTLYLTKAAPNTLGIPAEALLEDMKEGFRYYSYHFQNGYKYLGIYDLTGLIPEAGDITSGLVKRISGSQVYEPWKYGKYSEVASAYDIKHAIENGYWSDMEMSEDSANIVQNRVIKQYIDAKNKSKAKRYTLEGSTEPTSRLDDYPDAEPGDICVNANYKVWICLYAEAGGIVWSEIPTTLGSYLWETFYSKVQIDNKLKEKADKSDWELIRNITVEEELGAIEITKDENDDTFAYDDIIVIANNIKGTNGANWWLSVKTTANSSNAGLIQVGNANAVSSSTARNFTSKMERMFGINRYEYDSSYKNTGAYVSTINKGTTSTTFEITDSTKINYIRIHFSSTSTINAGTVMVYGRKRR